MERIKGLEQLIKYHKNKYYNEEVEISDEEYDALETELKELDPDNILLKTDIGAAVQIDGKGKKIKHKVIMGSLGKVTINEIQDNMDFTDKDTIMQWKYDGVSLAIRYSGGKLINASTRGDGITGIDVTEHVLRMKIPTKVNCKTDLEVRGEALISKKVFQEHFAWKAANPRNLVSGMLNRKTYEQSYFIEFIAYEVVIDRDEIKYYSDVFEFLTKNDFIASDHIYVTDINIQDKFEMFEENRNEYEYEVDGVVVKYDELALWSYDYERIPDHAMCIKFAAQKEQTKIKEIVWQIGNKGHVTPVATVDPVVLSGATITHVTLHNYGMVIEKGIQVGDIIEIQRSGDVIPKFNKIIQRSKGIVEIPQYCPECNCYLVVKGKFLVCTSFNCSTKKQASVGLIIKYLEIDGLGTEMIERLYNNGIDDPLLFLTITATELQSYCGMSNDYAVKVYKRIVEGKQRLSPEMVLASLNITGVGLSISTKIMSYFNEMEIPFEELFSKLSLLSNIMGIGDSVIKHLEEYKYFASDRLYKKLLLLLSTVAVKKVIPKLENNTLQGKSFILTGTLSKGRKEVQANITAQGGRIASTVNSADYVVVGTDAGSKYDKAKKANKVILSETQLMKMVNGE